MELTRRKAGEGTASATELWSRRACVECQLPSRVGMVLQAAVMGARMEGAVTRDGADHSRRDEECRVVRHPQGESGHRDASAV